MGPFYLLHVEGTVYLFALLKLRIHGASSVTLTYLLGVLLTKCLYLFMGAELFHADKAGRHIQSERKKGRKMDGPTDIRDLMFALRGGGAILRERLKTLHCY